MWEALQIGVLGTSAQHKNGSYICLEYAKTGKSAVWVMSSVATYLKPQLVAYGEPQAQFSIPIVVFAV
jgi:hypothetical protein